MPRTSWPAAGGGRRWLCGLAALSVVCLLTASACSSSRPRSSPRPTSGLGAGLSGPGRAGTTPVPPAAGGFGGAVPAPSRGLYLGLFDNAGGQTGGAPGRAGAYAQQVSLETQNHFRVAIDLEYTSWTTPLVTPTVRDDLGTGRIPLISWQCGTTDANVASGGADPMLISDARSVAALGKPVMIRWFWEMEFTGSNGGTQGQRAARCLGAEGPGGYVRAWRHIVDLFRANGATNVAWVFCPGQDAYSASAAMSGRAAAEYYPGSEYVDWVAEDAYSRVRPVALATLVAGMYREYGQAGKPLIVCETGAEGTYQPLFISGIAGLPSEYPNIRAVVYFDSSGPLGTYVMSQDAVAEFARLAADSQVIAASPEES